MGAIPKSLINFDARTKIFLLIAVSAFIFTNANHIAETILLIFLLLLAILLGVPKTAVKGVAIYVGIMLLNNFVLPNMPEVIAANFNILFVTFRKLLPCFLMGAILIKTTSIRLLIYALQKLHMPKVVIIPLTITVRYFPALKEEWSAISDAMKLRNVKGILRKIEYVYVPLMLSASTTADELSQALTARGIDNPCPKTCAVSMRFDIQDYILCLISLVLAVIAVISLLGGGTL